MLGGIAPPDAPFALIDRDRGALRLAAVSRGAARLGLMPGLALADARARVPDLATLAFAPDADAALLGRLAEVTRDYTPTVAVDPPQGLVLDIAGCAHLHEGGEAGLVEALTARLSAMGLTARIALADTADAARALARHGVEEVGRLPLAAIDPDGEASIALRRAGFRRVGDLATLPRAVLAARFGTGLTARLARVLGEESQPLVPVSPAEPIGAALRFAEPVGHAAHVLDAIESLLAEAGAALAERGQGGRVFLLTLHRSDGHVARLRVETGAPVREAPVLLRLFAERIETLADPLDPGFGYDDIALSVPVVEPLGERQGQLDGEEALRIGEALAPLLDRMAVRHGPEAVRRCQYGDSHVPERAGWLGPTALASSGTSSNARPRRLALPRETAAGDPPARPLALFDPPQPVEVIAAVPDGPPRRFRWKGTDYRVVRQEGPERIAAEWWRRREGHDANPGRTRDYYRVEDARGHRFWLFRHGLYGTEALTPRWYVHGLFG